MRLAEAVIPAGDDGLIRGDGAFDAFPVRDGRPFARAAHLDRLERSCQALALDCPREQLEADIDLLLTQAWAGDAAMRIVLTRGGHRLCRLESLGDHEGLTKPVRLLPVTYNPSVVLNGVKSLSYGANMLASRRAVAAGYDEALLVRSDGVVLEGPTCSIFWVRGRPSADAGARDRDPRLDHAPGDPREHAGRGGELLARARGGGRGGVPGLDRPARAADRRDRRGPPARGTRAADAEGPGGDRAGDGRGLDRLILDMRARDHGITIGAGTPGPLNAITDVAGVRVGHRTLIEGSGPLVVGQRTGPHRGDGDHSPGSRVGATDVRRRAPSQRQRRDDRPRVGARVRDAHHAGGAHQHPQRRRGPRRVAGGDARDRSGARFGMVAAGGGRDLGRAPQRPERLSRPAGARPRRVRSRRTTAPSRKARWAAVPG